MEALSSLTFKGSVTEAIIEAKTQKKLFVVYISGEDEDSNKLNNLTWTDSLVAESLSKYCILLCIRAESVDATHFSAIYPYSSVPCIAAIGFSGTQAWKNEGFISAQDLASSLEKAWLGLHIQETILSAALASQNSEQPASDVVLPSQGGSLDASPSTASIVQPSERKSTAASTSTKENNVGSGTAAVKRSESAEPSNSSDNAINQPASSVEVNKGNVEQGETSSHVQAEKEPIPPVAARPTNTSSVRSSSTDRKKKQGTVMNKVDSGSGVSGREINLAKSVGTKETIKPKDEAKEEDVESRRKLSDVHLNIRLPDGSSLQEKFSVTSILRMVKDYVNSNQTVGLGAYDLAVPYPRKVYSDQDLDKSLSELGLFDRQALVVVLRKGETVYQRGPSHSESNNNTEPENVNNGGYFAYVRRVMSYANPLSYFGGGTTNASSSGPDPRSGSNPELRNNVAQAGSLSRDPSEGRSNVRNRRPTASRIGSNIHTLKHDEEDAPFGDGNAFWNGNSTQYGGESGGDSNDRR